MQRHPMLPKLRALKGRHVGATERVFRECYDAAEEAVALLRKAGVGMPASGRDRISLASVVESDDAVRGCALFIHAQARTDRRLNLFTEQVQALPVVATTFHVTEDPWSRRGGDTMLMGVGPRECVALVATATAMSIASQKGSPHYGMMVDMTRRILEECLIHAQHDPSSWAAEMAASPRVFGGMSVAQLQMAAAVAAVKSSRAVWRFVQAHGRGGGHGGMGKRPTVKHLLARLKAISAAMKEFDPSSPLGWANMGYHVETPGAGSGSDPDMGAALVEYTKAMELADAAGDRFVSATARIQIAGCLIFGKGRGDRVPIGRLRSLWRRAMAERDALDRWGMSQYIVGESRSANIVKKYLSDTALRDNNEMGPPFSVAQLKTHGDRGMSKKQVRRDDRNICGPSSSSIGNGPPPPSHKIRVGAAVLVTGLKSAKSLNGRRGKITAAPDPEQDAARATVSLDAVPGRSGREARDVAVKRKNLRLVCAVCGCLAKDAPQKQLLACTRCEIAAYCSGECQKIGWKTGHRKVCKALRKQRKAAEAAQKKALGDVYHESWKSLSPEELKFMRHLHKGCRTPWPMTCETSAMRKCGCFLARHPNMTFGVKMEPLPSFPMQYKDPTNSSVHGKMFPPGQTMLMARERLPLGTDDRPPSKAELDAYHRRMPAHHPAPVVFALIGECVFSDMCFENFDEFYNHDKNPGNRGRLFRWPGAEAVATCPGTGRRVKPSNSTVVLLAACSLKGVSRSGGGGGGGPGLSFLSRVMPRIITLEGFDKMMSKEHRALESIRIRDVPGNNARPPPGAVGTPAQVAAAQAFATSPEAQPRPGESAAAHKARLSAKMASLMGVAGNDNITSVARVSRDVLEVLRTIQQDVRYAMPPGTSLPRGMPRMPASILWEKWHDAGMYLAFEKWLSNEDKQADPGRRFGDHGLGTGFDK